MNTNPVRLHEIAEPNPNFFFCEKGALMTNSLFRENDNPVRLHEIAELPSKSTVFVCLFIYISFSFFSQVRRHPVKNMAASSKQLKLEVASLLRHVG